MENRYECVNHVSVNFLLLEKIRAKFHSVSLENCVLSRFVFIFARAVIPNLGNYKKNSSLGIFFFAIYMAILTLMLGKINVGTNRVYVKYSFFSLFSEL